MHNMFIRLIWPNKSNKKKKYTKRDGREEVFWYSFGENCREESNKCCCFCCCYWLVWTLRKKSCDHSISSISKEILNIDVVPCIFVVVVCIYQLPWNSARFIAERNWKADLIDFQSFLFVHIFVLFCFVLWLFPALVNWFCFSDFFF